MLETIEEFGGAILECVIATVVLTFICKLFFSPNMGGLVEFYKNMVSSFIG